MDNDEILKALAHPKRVEILGWLKEPEAHFSGQHHPLEMGVCANQIEGRCGLSQSTVSSHLAILHRAGLLRTEKVGQWTFYKRDEDAIATFLKTLSASL